MSNRQIYIVLAVCMTSLIGGLMLIGSSNDSPFAANPAAPPALEGTWDAVCEAGFMETCSSEEAAQALEPTEIKCSWRGSNVIVRVGLRSSFNARLEVGIVPRYTIENGGVHGTSWGSDVSRTIEPQGEVTFVINAGHPEGVPVDTPISDCHPKLYDVDLIPLAGA